VSSRELYVKARDVREKNSQLCEETNKRTLTRRSHYTHDALVVAARARSRVGCERVLAALQANVPRAFGSELERARGKQLSKVQAFWVK
jgi:hypothetical protein